MSPDRMTETPPICDYEGSDYQTTFWEQGDRAYEDRVEAVALRRLLPPGGETLLEIGAGAGRHTPRYAGFQRVVLLDYSISQLQTARDRLGHPHRYLYVAADAYRLPFVPGLFEAATMIRTLHHMADAPLALHGARQVLKPGGTFILEYANKQNLKAIFRYLLQRQSWSPFSPEPVEFAELNFDFHPNAIKAWLHEAHFQIERQLTVSHFRMGFLKRWIPLGLLVRMDSLAQWTGNWWQLSPSVFLRARAVGGDPAPATEGFFRCPECGQALDHHPFLDSTPRQDGQFPCPGCGREWSLIDGIYRFR
jgi:ubiquinone/menaquinone biosynthesis C-methylase UbiE